MAKAHKLKAWFGALLITSIAVPGISRDTSDPAPHVKSITAIVEVFGDGQKVSAVALEYDTPIDNAKLKPRDFTVEGRDVARVYANKAAAKAPQGLNGAFVVLELERQRSTAPAQRFTPPPGFTGPKLGERRQQSSTIPPVAVKVLQSGTITTANGQTYKPGNDFRSSEKVINLVVQDFKQLVYKDPKHGLAPLMYNLYIPKDYDPAKKYPLVLFMHDAGVVSSNPTETLTQGLGAVIWATPEVQAKHACFVLAPQYEAVIADDLSQTGVEMDTTIDLVQDLAKKYSIDTTRLYNTGQSMGGMVSIAMDIKYPDLFAASLLVACQWDPSKVAPMAKMPLWIIVSEGDAKANPGQEAITSVLKQHGATVHKAIWSAESSPAEFAQRVDEMLAAHSSIKHTVFKGGSHPYTWQHAYSIEGVRDWLFDQKK